MLYIEWPDVIPENRPKMAYFHWIVKNNVFAMFGAFLRENEDELRKSESIPVQWRFRSVCIPIFK